MSASPRDTAYRVTFVCSGNICRSPMGEVVLRSMLADAGLGGEAVVDSFGTGDWHVGQPADPRTLQVLTARGYDGSTHRARQVGRADLAERDLVLAADDGHVRKLAARGATAPQVRLIRSFDPDAAGSGGLELDDPYYGDLADFERCLREVEAACTGVVDEIRADDAAH